MRIDDILYFSPKFKFSKLDWNNKENLIEAFKDRVVGFYLFPAGLLNEWGYAFAAGLLCLAAIDFLARINTGSVHHRSRSEEWLRNNIEYFRHNPDDVAKFYNDFRNGLVHEGRIKNGSQFSLQQDTLIHKVNSIMIVNPKKLLEVIDYSFRKHLKKLDENDSEFKRFKEKLESDFQMEKRLCLSDK